MLHGVDVSVALSGPEGQLNDGAEAEQELELMPLGPTIVAQLHDCHQ